jgi:FtsP/CotA-like multicopper oxidase with cupredoxin domain
VAVRLARQVKENPEINKDQPKPTKACVPPIDPKNSPNCGFPEIGAVAVPAQKPSYSDIRDITLVIADKALVAPSPRNPGSIFAELGYPVGQRGGCNSCTPPGADLNANNDTCTSATFGSACPATFDNTTGYCGRWSPEFFGYNNVVNGQVAPVLTVPTGGWYRLRLVNGANTRAYQLVFQADNVVNGGRDLIGESSPLCYKIATEAGYTRKPLTVASPLKMLPAERVELLCDFRFKDLSPTDTAVSIQAQQLACTL